MKSIKHIICCCVALALLAATANPCFAQKAQSPFLTLDQAVDNMTEEEALEAEAYALGVQTMLWGYQYVRAAATMRFVATPLPEGQERNPADYAPHAYHVWGHARVPYTHEIRTIEAPNSETPYSSAVIDLEYGPVVVVHPDHEGRYFRTSVWGGFGECRTISQKKDGDHPKPHLLARGSWKGKVPKGMGLIRFRSRLALLGPHIALTTEENDIENVRALQDGYKLIALKDWGKSNQVLIELPKEKQIRPLIRPNTSTPPSLILYEMLGEAMKDMTLYDDELGFVRQMKRIGFTDDGFDAEGLSEPQIRGLARAAKDAQSMMEYKVRTIADVQEGGTWGVGYDICRLDDWLFRAAAGWKWVWADIADEIIYPQGRKDADGNPFSGQHRYTIRFEKGEHAPARYWQISMYALDAFFVDNPIGRYGIGNMNTDLDVAEDGSITICIQHESPGKDKENNWLPTPADGFYLQMRMYQPEERMYAGEYIVPPVTRE